MLVFTSCVNNYLPKARVLATSLRAQHPDWRFCLLLGEEPPAGFDLAKEPFDRLMQHEELGIPNLQAFRFKHSVVEISTAVKGQAFRHFFEKENEPEVMYLDPDILVLASLAPLRELLASHDILLTPHFLTPQRGRRAIEDNELSALRHGIFNLGFLACANRREGRAFARFWADRLRDYCHDDKARGLFTDQKWCDFVPAYFPAAGIVRDPGYNAASWNLTERRITRAADGQYLANGLPLRFYHFTGHDSGSGRLMTHIYGKSMPAVAELWQIYDQKLAAAGQESLLRLGWRWNSYHNGEAVSDAERMYYRASSAAQELYPDPYVVDETGKSCFAEYWRQERAREKSILNKFAGRYLAVARICRMRLRECGGIGAAPVLLAEAARIFRNGGLSGLRARAREHKIRMDAERSLLLLEHLLAPTLPAHHRLLGALEQGFLARKTVLIIDHCYGGGANAYRAKRIDTWLGQGTLCLLATWELHEKRMRLDFHIPDGSVFTVRANDLSDLLRQDIFHFDHILVSELVHWSVNAGNPRTPCDAVPSLLRTIIEIARKNNAVLEFALHDFFAICPVWHLMENDHFCSVPADQAQCHKCLQLPRDDIPGGIPADLDVRQWRATWQEAFDQAQHISIFSQNSANLLARCFTFKPGAATLKPHAPLTELAAPILATGAMHIAVIGNIGQHKGADIVRQLAAMLAKGEKLSVIGQLAGDIPANVYVTGPYEHAALPDIVEELGANICLVPSICPETFCFTALEARQMELPLVVFPLGAQVERVEGYAKGLVAENISAEAALKALRKLHANVGAS